MEVRFSIMGNGRSWTTTEQYILTTKAAMLTAKDLAKELNRPLSVIYHRLWLWGIKAKRRSK
jgi:hypothetical protein